MQAGGMNSYLMAMVATNIASILCVIIAGLMLYLGKGGWGWFLFAALLLSTTVEFKEKKKSDKSKQD